MGMIIKKGRDIIGSYFQDASNLKGGYASEAVFPDREEQISELLAECHSKKTPVTISGGGTGTAGARIPFGGIVISTERLDKINEISVEKMSARLQPGVLVDDLRLACEQKGLFYTSHPTERTASVGGTVSTNASGARSFKYGSIRQYVNRLRMVLADGEVLEIKRGERFITRSNNILKLSGGRSIIIPLPGYKIPDIKNSAGYFIKDGSDLIDLFIGQEGTLSIITEIELAMVKKPDSILSAFVFFRQEKDAWDFSARAAELSKGKTAYSPGDIDALSIEYFDSNALDLLRGKVNNIPGGMNAAVFFEQEAGSGDEDGLWQAWASLITEHNAALDDTWVAMGSKDGEYFSKLRHCLPEAVNDIVRQRGLPKLSTDIAVPPEFFREMMGFYSDIFKKSKIAYVIFGHIGECHVHTNLLAASAEELDRGRDICLETIKKCVSLGGTITAEHGVGKTKNKYLEIMYGREGVMDMAKIKKACDPNCILGQGNIFSKEVRDSLLSS
ncbi:MAG: FAD-binding oxidoreductase [Candidatus Omnitrophica bacterium]|jgi:D-lactate dehydrogenase (cytochrome)|nr:FAD-binding oxidoreductase [Candidatus Omnitrophota bacterium]MDD5079762.1 FAD-binding oxidoreductase [Candidatus Omnitrophota bacterium]